MLTYMLLIKYEHATLAIGVHYSPNQADTAVWISEPKPV